jgi:AcrR family transcriptional regulator
MQNGMLRSMYNIAMNEQEGPRLSGRQAQAARNDELILEAARTVFTADPDAPISAVAERAGVGISALYRRYPSKEDLLRKLSMDGLQRYLSLVEGALADNGDSWEGFVAFMRRALDADTHALTLHLAGTFTPTPEMWQEGDRAARLNVELIERVKAAGVLRPEIEVGDISLLFEMLASIELGDRARTMQLRHRYLAMLLEAMRREAAGPLPGPAPSWPEVSARYAPKA